RVFKITRDGRERLTWMKITGGSLKVRDVLSYSGRGENFISGSGESTEETDTNEKNEKITQIRLYSGEKFTALPEAEAGSVVAVCGLTDTYAGQGLGEAQTDNAGLVVPILTWQVLLPQGTDPFRAYRDLCVLEEEEPMLSVRYNERKKEITVSLMGEIQREILKNLAMQRFGLEINYGRPSIIYKETIRTPVEGVGHFEPLRHYAEVHLLLTPGEPGSGLVFESMCPVDSLAKNWQRLVLTHLRERKHRGVLTGSEITDMKITLIGGRAHEKHTEGGDFRQATYRAVRQGLMMAENILLEPFYSFRMELPGTALGRALTDLQQMGASFSQPDFSGDNAILVGEAPVSAFGDYAETLSAYTKGQGHLLTEMGGYRPCRDPDAVIEEIGYDPDSDKRNPTSSVFCSHGAGVIVPWYEVRNFMHVDTGWREGVRFAGPVGGKNQVSRAGAGSAFFEEGSYERSGSAEEGSGSFGDGLTEAGYRGAEGRRAAAKRAAADERSFKEREADQLAAEGELMAIFERTYGPIKDRSRVAEASPRKVTAEPAPKYRKPKKQPDKEYLLVDGYNIIFAWEELRKLASGDMKAARDRLLDILANYAGYVKRNVICVFDAYKVAGGSERIYRHHNIDVIFTKEAETADLYIERAAHELSRQYRVTVATSDAVEQVIIYGAGALRLSAQNFYEEVKEAEREMKTTYVAGENGKLAKIGTNLGEELKGILEEKD
ncbi:MAG: TetM/TetW/TetO/TetS family tetracycline resistance ribosomal protection protein, partial [Lachnospiraceae bacterium]|nr:TetM/TetW/TetO/TetS family tetracycline resistance ribosomal protection protein [Lachnospiraceae bacterium]